MSTPTSATPTPGKVRALGVLAYGSLIDDPGEELREVIVETIRDVETPFSVEYARSSRSRGGAPTLVPVSSGGARVAAAIHVLSPQASIDRAKDLVWRRETQKFGKDDHYRESERPSKKRVFVDVLRDYAGLEAVLFTRIAPNIEPLTATELARLAILSAHDIQVGPGRDGLSYLLNAMGHGIHTPLTDAYVAEILRQTGSFDLQAALESVRPTIVPMTKEERARIVNVFCEDCIWVHAMRDHFKALFESGDKRKSLLQECAKTFFGDLSLVLQEYLLLQIAKILDPHSSGAGKTNLTANYLLSLNWDSGTKAALEVEAVALNAFREKIAAARNKLLSHTDVQARVEGAELGEFLPEEEEQFWAALQRFVDAAHEDAIGGPCPIDSAAPEGDASSLIQVLVDAVDYADMVESNTALLVERSSKRRYDGA
jgi:cation transport regulator ChaC